MAKCRSCGAPIFWAVTTTNMRIPLDEKPTPSGNIELRVSYSHPRAVASVITANNPRRGAADALYTSHFATCPHASLHRKRK